MINVRSYWNDQYEINVGFYINFKVSIVLADFLMFSVQTYL